MRIYPLFLPFAGCPHRCVFCRQEEGGTPDPREAVRQIERMLPAAGGGEIAFYGGSFTLLGEGEQRDYLRGAGRFVAAGRAAGIRISTRPDALSQEAVRLLAQGGVTTVEIGCQSFCDKVLRLAGRGHDAAEAAEAVARLRERGIRIGLQLMPGLPGGSREEGLGSLAAALALRPDFLRIYPAVVFRGTRLEEMWRAGLYTPLELEDTVELCADLLVLCRKGSVPVIRLGLQGTPGMEASLLAGPWHPAFGHLVRSRLWRRALVRLAESIEGSRAMEVHPADLSDATGHRRENLLWMQRRSSNFALVPDETVRRGELRVGDRQYILDELVA